MAWRKFSRGKRARPDVQVFQADLTRNIKQLHHELISGLYCHGPYQPFTIFDPKQRKIHKAAVKDRLVHQAVVSAIEPLFERRFIYDSYSCRAGKGTHAGVARLRQFLQKASLGNSRTVYGLKCDIRKFFDSVHHATLLDLIERQIDDRRTMELIEAILASFTHTPGKGLPLGNVTSQLFANIYLHEFDFFVKQSLRHRFYIRYCDDFVMIHQDKHYLAGFVPKLALFLEQRLQLTLHPAKISMHSYHQGIDFLGYVLKPRATLLRRKTQKRMLHKVNARNLSSYLGVCSHATSYNLERVLVTIGWQNYQAGSPHRPELKDALDSAR